MAKIKRIDAHPQSWRLATEYQRLKRKKTGNQQVKKKVLDERKKREESVNASMHDFDDNLIIVGGLKFNDADFKMNTVAERILCYNLT